MMKYLLILFCALSLSFVAIQTQATDAPPLVTLNDKQQPAGSGEIIGQLPGSGQALAVQGDLIFVGFGNELAIIDVTDKTMPEEISRLDMGELVRDIAVNGAYAYLATDSGLQVIDISQPTDLQWASLFERTLMTKVLIQDGYAYTLSSEGFDILDLAQAPQLDIVGRMERRIETPLDLDIIDNYAFFRAGSPDRTLNIIDFTNEQNLIEIHQKKNFLSNQIALTSNRYLAVDHGCSQTCSSWLSILSWDEHTWDFIFIGAATYYFSELSRTVETDGIYAYAGKDVGLYVYGVYHNTTNIGTPLLIEWFDVGYVHDIIRGGNYLYVISEDLNNFPNPPREGGFYILPAPPLYHAYMPFVPVNSSLLIHHNK